MMGLEHIANLLHLDGVEVSAIADPHPCSRAAAAELVPAAALFETHVDLVEARICDAVVVATPNMTHAEVLTNVLLTDLHVLIEKPLCITVQQCQQVTAMAEARDALTWVGLEYRYMPAVARVLSEAQAGTVGEPLMVAIREHRFPFLVKVGDWNRFNRNTGGTLVEKCCHFFDLMCRVMPAEPLRVLASGGQLLNHLDERYGGEIPDIDDHAFVVVEFGHGGRAMLDLCMFADSSRFQTEVSVVGARAKLRPCCRTTSCGAGSGESTPSARLRSST